MFDDSLGSYEKALKTLESTVESAKIKLFDNFSGVFEGAINGATTLVNTLTDFKKSAVLAVGAVGIAFNKWFSGVRASSKETFAQLEKDA